MLILKNIIFLHTYIDICMKRWQARKRREEMYFSVKEMTSYLTLLRKNYLELYGKEYRDQLVVVRNNDKNLITQTMSGVLEESAWQ